MAKMSTDGNARPIQAVRPSSAQNVTVSGASAASTAFIGNLVRLYSSVDVYVTFGTAPVATTSGMFLPAGYVEYFRCEPGEKVAALAPSGSGTLNVTEFN